MASKELKWVDAAVKVSLRGKVLISTKHLGVFLWSLNFELS